MFQYFLRLVKRFAVLLPGIVIAYFSIKEIFPLVDKRFPLAIAVFITYGLGAYLFVPAIIRLWRIIHPAKHLPLYCVTPDGFASDPLNVSIIGTRLQIIEAMTAAGWFTADHHSLRNAIHEGLSAVYGWSYPTAPVSNLYLFGRKQDIAFQIPIEGKAGQRHHVRFWAMTYDPGQPLNIRALQRNHRREHVKDDELLWIGAASLDVGIGYIRHNLQITHTIAPDTNQERQLIVDQLKDQKLVKSVKMVKLGEPYKLINRVMRGSLHTDGQLAVIKLN